MYSVGEEFEKLIEDDLEYFTCIANFNVGDKEYLICENENGVKRVFNYDTIEEDIILLEEDEADEILEVWEEEYYGTDKDYMYWNEEFGEYDEITKNDIESFDDLSDDTEGFMEEMDGLFDEDDSYDEDEEDLKDFLEEFFE